MQWYEKFKWFISSENYLVISGRDALQSELLIKRHLRRGDVYVHADVPGASSCIVRNIVHPLPIAPLTLEEAGHFCMCNSSAWESRTVTSAWWVHKEQVSKTAPTGEYLPAGSFVVRGKKNFLQPSRLELGFGILFRIDEKSVATHHAGERPIRSMDVEAERARVARKVEAEEAAAVAAAAAEEEEGLPAGEAEVPGRESPPVEDAATAPPAPASDTPKASGFSEENKEEQKEKEGEKKEEEEEAGEVVVEEEKGATPSSPTTSTSARENLVEAAALAALAIKTKKNGGGRKKGGGPSQPEAKEMNRGQRRRMKKMKKKYANQSEDERRMRMAALGNPLQAPPSLSESPKDEINGGEKEGDGADDKTAAGGGGSKKATSFAIKSERKRAAKVAADRRMREIETEEPGGSDNLDTLTGKPCAEDVFRYALPVCAPYTTLAKYKFKVKLTPGGSKRGRASQEAMDVFLRMPVQGKGSGVATEKEKEFIRLISDNERVQAMVAKVKVSRPASAAGGKKGKKKKKKGGGGGGGGKKAKGAKGGGRRAAAGKKR